MNKITLKNNFEDNCSFFGMNEQKNNDKDKY